MYKIIAACILASILPFAFSDVWAASGAPAVERGSDVFRESKPLAVVVTRSREGGITSVADSTYDGLFQEPSAEAGVLSIIRKGNFRINGFPIPPDERSFSAVWPQGFTVNGRVWLSEKNGVYTVDKKNYTDYGDAVLALVRRIPAGLETDVYDRDGDGKGDAIDATVWEAVIPQTINANADGTVTMERLGDSDFPSILPGEGRRYDDSRFTPGSGDTIGASHMDPSIHPGDVALFAYMPFGWTVKRAIPVTGPLEAARDHRYYQMGGVRYHDAMRFARDNLPISNRNGEFVNTLKYFHQMHRPKAPAVTLWFVPISDGELGAPAGFTSGANGPRLLKEALNRSRQELDQVVISTDGSQVPPGKGWMTQKGYDQAKKVIESAQAVYDHHKDSVLMDYERYLLFLALHGSKGDIGAAYGGYEFEGIHRVDPPAYDQ